MTAEALAHLMLMAASCGAADFAAADRHADQAARIADRYDLPAVAAAISIYRALRAALDGDLAGAESCTSRQPLRWTGSGCGGTGLG